MEVKAEWSIEDILARLTALEALVRDSDSSLFDGLVKRVDELEGYCAACKAHDGVCERLQALEERLSDPPTWKTFDAALKRIEALEASDVKVTELREAADRALRRVIPIEQRVEDWDKHLRGMDIFAHIEERDRQARWHATRDAYVTGHLARGRAAGDDDLVFHWAKAFADRAHGPLEGKASDDIGERHIKGSYPHESPELVNALVKAARSMLRAFNARSSDHWLKDSIEAAIDLDHQLEPFEVAS